jgi:thiamine-monophosphate kinase
LRHQSRTGCSDTVNLSESIPDVGPLKQVFRQKGHQAPTLSLHLFTRYWRSITVKSNEDSFIDAIKRLVDLKGPKQVGGLGIGDDAALLAVEGQRQVVLSVDDHCEGVHFRHEWCPPMNIGLRAAGSALSDLAAMGAKSRGALLSIQRPETVSDEDLLLIVEGVISKLGEFQCPLVGGNLSASKALNLSITVVGELAPGSALLRSLAKVGDDLWLSGPLGRSLLAFQSLEQGLKNSDFQQIQDRYLNPTPRFDVIDGGIPAGSACMDISDGLVRDATRMAHASQKFLVVDNSALMTPVVQKLAPIVELDPQEIVFRSGEEYELLLSIAPQWRESMEDIGLLRVGQVEDLEGRRPGLSDESGRTFDPDLGFDHFSKDL